MSRQSIKYPKYKPNNINDLTWRALIEAWENGLSDREAAFHVQKKGGTLTAEDIQTLIVDNPELGELKVALASDLLSLAKGTIAEALREGDIKTAKWYAERKGADEFSTKQAVALEGAVIELSIEEKRQATKDYIESMKQNGEQ